MCPLTRSSPSSAIQTTVTWGLPSGLIVTTWASGPESIKARSSGVMMLIITGVGFLIHLYATSYMEKDEAYWRFFSYLNLFIFAMLVLVLADNLPLLFVGWEGVGLCSYLNVDEIWRIPT